MCVGFFKNKSAIILLLVLVKWIKIFGDTEWCTGHVVWDSIPKLQVKLVSNQDKCKHEIKFRTILISGLMVLMATAVTLLHGRVSPGIPMNVAIFNENGK